MQHHNLFLSINEICAPMWYTAVNEVMQMQWHEQYGPDTQPSVEEMAAFVSSDLWGKLTSFLETAYQINPKQNYSKCSGQPGWNVKYQKSGKSLCVLYPMEGFFIALVVIGEKEKHEMELLLPALSPVTQTAYKDAIGIMNAKWLMLSVTTQQMLEDVEALVQLRVKAKRQAVREG